MIIVSIAEAMLINIRGVETIGAPAAIFAHPVFPRQLALLSRKRISATVTAASGHWVMATVMPQQLALLDALATTVAAVLAGCNDELAHLMSNGAWSRYCTAALPERQATGSGASRLRAASVESKLRLASRGARLGPCNHSRTRPGSLKPLPMGPRVPAAIDAL